MPRKTTTLPPRWLPSSRAAEALGVSKFTLKRYADAGVLTEGTHYRRGLFPRSPWTFEVQAIHDLLTARARPPERPDAKPAGRPPRPGSLAAKAGEVLAELASGVR